MYFAILFALLLHVQKHITGLLRTGEIGLRIAVHLRAVAADEAQTVNGIILVVSGLNAREHTVPTGRLVAVNVAPWGAQIARPCDRGRHNNLLNVPLQPAPGDFLIALHTFAGDLIFDFEVVLFRDFFESVAGVEL